VEIDTLSDPARFARAIRGLARDAHETLTHSPSPATFRGLTRRIDVLGAALGDRRGGPVGTWLDTPLSRNRRIVTSQLYSYLFYPD
jgi:hypothetical protein